ncbi:hypothetical protein GLOIN_2v1752839 [Rhizophagus clarus]|uniref:PH domain-containing protein n=1 Tax=Rhizophagus clarus TaxID=94130 RepID=A0A8H3L385_9GLOM|nr:hypothetical protein GLOIN_2v1752839 [Rhizophagus clarus]
MTNNNLSQDLTFSLISRRPDTVLTEFIAKDYAQYSEWTDGLNMLLDKNINSKFKWRKVEIPKNIEVPNKSPIIGTDGSGFYYDDEEIERATKKELLLISFYFNLMFYLYFCLVN